MRKATSAILTELGISSDKHLSELSDARIAEICGEVSFEASHFRRRIAVRDRWTQLITAHLFLEHISIEFLDQEFVNKGVLRIDRWGLLQKVELLRALGVLSVEIFSQIVKINTLRNRAAHSYKFSVTDKEVKDLVAMFPSGMFKEVDRSPTLMNALYCTVAFFEHERKSADIRTLMAQKAGAKLRLALVPFEKIQSSAP